MPDRATHSPSPYPLDRSGFSAFLGDPIGQPGDRPHLQRVLNYILRPALPLKHLSYVESTGEVRYSPRGDANALREARREIDDLKRH